MSAQVESCKTTSKEGRICTAGCPAEANLRFECQRGNSPGIRSDTSARPTDKERQQLWNCQVHSASWEVGLTPAAIAAPPHLLAGSMRE